MATLEAYSSYNLPSVAALIRYFHTSAGYPVRPTWLTAISTGNYSSCPGLTLANATMYCPSATATIMGNLVIKDKESDPLNPNSRKTSSPDQQLSQVCYNELHIQGAPISKLYTDDTGRFPDHACIGNQYIMIAYHCDAKLMLAKPFASRKNKHHLLAYDKIMRRLSNNKLTVDLQILYNEASIKLALQW